MQFTIDTNKNNWTDDLKFSSEDEKNTYFNNLLYLGYTVLKSSQFTIDSNSLFRPLTNDLNHIKDTIDDLKEEVIEETSSTKEQCVNLNNAILKLTGNISTSSLKGKIGENFVENTLTNHFPDDTVKQTAMTGHESDFHLISSEYPNILVESKIYTNVVNSNEIEKFFKDLETTGIDYGVFISLTSGIIKHRRFDYEFSRGKHVIFIPNAGFDGHNLIYAILFLRELSKISKENLINESLFKNKKNMINTILQNFDLTYTQLIKLKTKSMEFKNIVDKQLLSLTTEIIESELVIKNIIETTKKSILDTMSLDNCCEDYINKNNNYDEFITDLSKQKNTKNLATHVKLLQDYSFTMNKNDKNHIFFEKKNNIIDLKVMKSKCIFEFKNFNIKYEINENSDLSKFKNIIDLIHVNC